MSAELAAEITALIMAWDNAPFAEKRSAKLALDNKLRALIADATSGEIESTIQHFRNRQVKEAKDRQRKENTPKL